MTLKRAQFTLQGKSAPFDSRCEAVRGDLADVSLAGKLFAPHYAQAVEFVCTNPFTAMRETPDGAQNSELLIGEAFMVLDVSGDWAWGWSAHDHYVGYVETAALKVGAPSVPSSSSVIDPIEAAEHFLGMPYVWGGRGGAGIDCSGLVQRGLAAAGIAAPRDSDMQAASLGDLLLEGVAAQRGDIIFFPGHVGMMFDQQRLIHATRHHGKTIIEPLSDVVERVKAKNDGISMTACRRITPLCACS
jgi:cell wall-associated NlpC family hydrolase